MARSLGIAIIPMILILCTVGVTSYLIYLAIKALKIYIENNEK